MELRLLIVALLSALAYHAALLTVALLTVAFWVGAPVARWVLRMASRTPPPWLQPAEVHRMARDTAEMVDRLLWLPADVIAWPIHRAAGLLVSGLLWVDDWIFRR